MNSLSWMIYAADAVGELDCTLTFVAIMCVFSIPFAFIAKKFSEDFLSRKAEDVTAAAKARALKVMPVAAVIIILLNVLIPSRNTIYAIAASEMGEQVLKSPTVTKAQAALDAWLDKQIGNNKPEK